MTPLHWILKDEANHVQHAIDILENLDPLDRERIGNLDIAESSLAIAKQAVDGLWVKEQ